MNAGRSSSADEGGSSRGSNSRMHPLLRVAILKGKADAVRMQLAAGLDVDGVDARGRTALMLAVEAGHAEICRLLLNAGADPFVSDHEGLTAAHRAAAHDGLRDLFPDPDDTPTEEVPKHELDVCVEVEVSDVTVDPAAAARVPDDSATTAESEDPIWEPDSADGGWTVDPWTPESVAEPNPRAAFPPISPPKAPAPSLVETASPSAMRAPSPVEDLGGWEAEETPQIPVADDRVGFGESSSLNTLIATHRALDDAEDWDEIVVVLPVARPRRARTRIEREALTAARALFRRAARDGYLGRTELRRVLDEHFDDAPIPSRALEIALDSFATLADDDFPPSGWIGEATDDIESDDDGLPSEAADDAFEHFLDLAGASADHSRWILSSHATKPLPEVEIRGLCGRLADCRRRAQLIVASRLPGTDGFESAASSRDLRHLLERRVHDTDAANAVSELIALEREWRSGLTRLVVGNLRLVRWTALRFARAGVPIEDLIQEGTLGLFRAVDKFDPGRSVAFSTYAKWWIRAAMSRYLDNAAVVDSSGGAIELLRNIDEVERSLKVRGVAPTVRRIAEILGREESSIEGALARRLEVVYFDDADDDEHEPFLVDPAVPQDDGIDAARLGVVLRRHLEDLPPRQRDILLARHGFDDDEPHTLSELGARVGLSRERIRQLERAANETLRKHPAVVAFSPRGHP